METALYVTQSLKEQIFWNFTAQSSDSRTQRTGSSNQSIDLLHFVKSKRHKTYNINFGDIN